MTSSTRGILAESRSNYKSSLLTASQGNGSDLYLSRKFLDSSNGTKATKTIQFKELSSSLPSYTSTHLRSEFGSASDLSKKLATSTSSNATGRLQQTSNYGSSPIRPDPSSMKSLVLSSTAAVSGSPPVYPSAIRRHNGDTGGGTARNHVSFLSPPVESFAELPSSITSTSSPLPYSGPQKRSLAELGSNYDGRPQPHQSQASISSSPPPLARPQPRPPPTISSISLSRNKENIEKKDWKTYISCA